MFNLKLTPEDKGWLSGEHPLLKIEENPSSVVISGGLEFEMIYEPVENHFLVFPPKNYKGKGVLIEDRYGIKIVVPKSISSDLPKVYAEGSRLIEVAKQKSLPIYDLHFSFDGSACLYVVGKEKEYFPNGFDFKIFINQLVIPFFYAQTYFQKFGKWPWGEYAHGIVGIFEWYNEQKIPNKSDVEQMLKRLRQSGEWGSIAERFDKGNWIKGHSRCLCGSGEKIRNCHKAALKGMWKFGKDLKKYEILKQ
ncbi:MAG: hypothetical protein ABIB61_01655 [Candidatus Shapirobacteria bacterium]